MHFHSAGALAFDGVVDNADGGGVVNMYGRWGLGMSQLFQRQSEDFCFLCIQE